MGHRWTLAVAALLGATGCGEATLDAQVSKPAEDVAIQALEPALEDAVHKNLRRIEADIDTGHLNAYGLHGGTADRFKWALGIEFAQRYPDIYRRRMEVLASIAFIRAPHILPPAEGRRTIFHGMDEAQYRRLMDMEDLVFHKLVSLNGGKRAGVPPFSVCETRYLIEHHAKDPSSPLPERFTLSAAEWESYRTGYAAYAASCPQKDLEEWINFRGLGHLRPTWVESNLMDRFTRRLRSMCQWKTWDYECHGFWGDPLPYRDWRAQDVSRRFLHYDASQEAYLADTSKPVVLVPDRNWDGVGEMVTPANVYRDDQGNTHPVTITSTGSFSGVINTEPWRIELTTDALDGYDPQVDLARPDMGLVRVLPKGSCDVAAPTPLNCPLLKRLYVLMDRHVHFYQAYTNLDWDDRWIGKQPSPLVASSFTLAAADDWARKSPSGVDGFVFVMRIPFRDIFAGREMAVSTLAPVPDVTSVQDVYTGKGTLDFSRAWLDVATLSNNRYAYENEISKYGWVRPEQIEGIIYVGTPADVQ